MKKIVQFSEDKKELILELLKNSKYKKFHEIIICAISNWKNRKPQSKHYGVANKHGFFKTQEYCCLISAALNGKKIFIEDFRQIKNCNIYDYHAQRHFNLNLSEIRGLVFGFDLFEPKFNSNYDEISYKLGCEIHNILFK